MENYEGASLFLDSDIIVRCDIHELFDLADDTSIQVVKKKETFEWPAVMLFKNDKCKKLTEEFVENYNPQPNVQKQTFDWATDGVGSLPEKYHFLVDYDTPTEDEPSILHYTSGTPAFVEQRKCDYADLWYEERDHMLSTCSWLELMGNSVHTQKVLKNLKGYKSDYLAIESNQPGIQRTVQRTTQL